MFFEIAKQHQENYPCHWHLGNFLVSTDSGWQRGKINQIEILYKGYVDTAPLESLLEQVINQTTPSLTGNFCVLAVKDQVLKIHTDKYRSFPIYIDHTGVNNLLAKSRTAWCDSVIELHEDLTVVESKFDVIGQVDCAPTTISDIDDLLSSKILEFSKQLQSPLKVFLSGGVDTLLLYSYVKFYDLPHELVWNQHCDFDWFWLSNHSTIQKNWGYTQIHHWTKSTVLVSGTPGDEFTLRSPVTANYYLLHHGTSILNQLMQDPKCLHSEYFKQYTELFATQMTTYQPAKDWNDLVWTLCNININDWQHWHLGNTITWTPLRDLDLFKMFLHLPQDLALAQIMNSTVSRALIEKNVPGLTKALSDQKNAVNHMKNIRLLLDNNYEC